MSTSTTFSIKGKTKRFYITLASLMSVFVLTFIFAFIASSVFAPVNKSNADTIVINYTSAGYTASISSAATIDLSLEGTPTGAVAIAHDTVNTKTNDPNGYKLYLSVDQKENYDAMHPGNALYLDGDSTSNYFVSATSGTFSEPTSLDTNSWGFALLGGNERQTGVPSTAANFDELYIDSNGQGSDGEEYTSVSSDAKFAGIPLYNSAYLVQEVDTATTASGNDLDVYYGVKANSSLSTGNYTGIVNYFLLPETSSASLSTLSIYPASFSAHSATELTITTSLYTNANLTTSDVSVTLTPEEAEGSPAGTACSVTEIIPSLSSTSGAVTVKCTTSSSTEVGTKYTVTLSIPNYSLSYEGSVETFVGNSTLIADGTTTAPSFNASNFTTLDTTATTNYYFGQYGNAFYGVSDGIISSVGDDGGIPPYWELIDTDSSLDNSTLFHSKASSLLSTTNGAINTYFSTSDTIAMKHPANDITKTAPTAETISASNAYLWPLTVNQFNNRSSIITNITTSLTQSEAQERVIRNCSQTRTYYGRYQWYNTSYGILIPFDGAANSVQFCTGDTTYNEGTGTTWIVHPAFNLDLAKVLVSKTSTDAQTSTALSSYAKPSSDMKFLINSGSEKSNLEITAINGTSIPTTSHSTAYTLSYTNASTTSLNSGTNYLSAILYDTNGLVKYYGNLGQISSESGTATLDIGTNTLASGTYTLAIFEEEKVDAYKTDYASEPVYMTLEID